MHDTDNLEDLALLPIENPNPVMRAAADGTILYANRASDQLLASWNVERGACLPLAWRSRITDSLASEEGQRLTVLGGDQLYELDLVPIVARGYVNVYGRGVSTQAAYQARLLEHVNDAILAFDADLRITAWNRRAEELYGWRAEEVMGAYAPDIVGSQSTPEERAANLRTIAETGRWQGEIRHTRRDGTPIQIEATSMALVDDNGRIFAHVSVNRDITERKRAELAIRQQSQRLEFLHETDRSILAARAPADIARAVIGRLQRVTQAERVTVVLCDFAAQTAEIIAEVGKTDTAYSAGRRAPLASYPNVDEIEMGRVATVPDMVAMPDSWPPKQATLAAGIRSATLVPVAVETRVIGMLTISRAEPGPLPREILDLALEAADSLAVALYNAQLAEQIQVSREQLQSLSHRLVQLQELERSQVAKELYDDEGQRLAAVLIELELIEKQAAGHEALTGRIAGVKDQITHVLTDMHGLAVSLRPASLDRLGLTAALRQFAEDLSLQHGFAIHIEMGTAPAAHLSPLAETTVYRIAQEALTNAVLHSGGKSLGVVAAVHDSRFVIVIEDDGQGFDVDDAQRSGRLGLLAMSERAEMLGGRLTIESTPGSGTAVYIEVPVREE